MIANSKILVIDDEPEVLELTKKRLERAGYQVITASDGMKGFEDACEQKPNLILLDIMMPEMDGLTVLRKLRAEDSTYGIPVIMVTAKGQTDSMFEAEKYGSTDYFIKPFEWDALLKFIKRYLARF